MGTPSFLKTFYNNNIDYIKKAMMAIAVCGPYFVDLVASLNSGLDSDGLSPER
jgi:hypothetical protein